MHQQRRALAIGRHHALIVAGERHRYGKLCRLGRLQDDRPDFQPARRAAAHHAEEIDHYEEHDHHGIGGPGKAGPDAKRQEREADHKDKTDAEARYLVTPEIGFIRRGRLRDGVPADREQHGDAGQPNADDQQDDTPRQARNAAQRADVCKMQRTRRRGARFAAGIAGKAFAAHTGSPSGFPSVDGVTASARLA